MNMVTMYHPTRGIAATVTMENFREVWAPLRWTLERLTDEQYARRAERHAEYRAYMADLEATGGLLVSPPVCGDAWWLDEPTNEETNR